MNRSKARYKKAKKSIYYRAFSETLLIWFISSLIPVITIWFIGLVTNNDSYTGIWRGFSLAWSEYFIPTEVFLYITAIIASSIAFMVLHWRARKHERMYFTLLAIFALLFFFTAIIYALSKVTDNLNDDFIFYFAVFAYIGSLVAWYFTQVAQSRLQNKVTGQFPESGAGISLSDEG